MGILEDIGGFFADVATEVVAPVVSVVSPSAADSIRSGASSIKEWGAGADDDVTDWANDVAEGFENDPFGKDGIVTNFVQDYIPGGGFVTAAVHAAAGNDDYAEYAAVKGVSTTLVTVGTVAGTIVGGPAGAIAAGALTSGIANVWEGGMRDTLSPTVKDKLAPITLEGVLVAGVVGGVAAGVGYGIGKQFAKLELPNVFGGAGTVGLTAAKAATKTTLKSGLKSGAKTLTKETALGIGGGIIEDTIEHFGDDDTPVPPVTPMTPVAPVEEKEDNKRKKALVLLGVGVLAVGGGTALLSDGGNETVKTKPAVEKTRETTSTSTATSTTTSTTLVPPGFVPPIYIPQPETPSGGSSGGTTSGTKPKTAPPTAAPTAPTTPTSPTTVTTAPSCPSPPCGG